MRNCDNTWVDDKIRILYLINTLPSYRETYFTSIKSVLIVLTHQRSIKSAMFFPWILLLTCFEITNRTHIYCNIPPCDMHKSTIIFSRLSMYTRRGNMQETLCTRQKGYFNTFCNFIFHRMKHIIKLFIF